jgi:hypothetical protein
VLGLKVNAISKVHAQQPRSREVVSSELVPLASTGIDGISTVEDGGRDRAFERAIEIVGAEGEVLVKPAVAKDASLEASASD